MLKLFSFVVACTTLAGSAQQPTRPELAEDRAHRDGAIHWPREFDPGVAPVFSHNELLIHTDCHRAFARLADAADWPNWLVLVKDAASETPGSMRQGSLLRLKIFSSPIQSRVVEFVPDQRISWIPFGADESEARHGHFHAWRFVPEPAACLVVTEETGIGPDDIKDPVGGSHLMHKAHELWLASLKWTSEQ